MSPRLSFALETAWVAGKATLPYFQTGVQVDLKDDNSPVTEADRAAERVIRRAIEKHFPNDGILGEEEGSAGSIDARWVIDPIDGTKSFICGVPLFGTLLSYEVNQQPLVAVAYFPALDELVYAEKGEGCFWNGKVCKVSEQQDIDGAVLSCGSLTSMHAHQRLPGLLNLSKDALAVRGWSDAYGHCLVATGRIDAMIDPIVSHWDVSSPALLVREAGGAWTDFSGNQKLTNEAISSNGKIHQALTGAF